MSTSEAEVSIVEAWATKHSDPKFQTDLWIIVNENGEEIRIPACAVILRMHSSLVQGLPMDTDELHIPAGLGDHDARTVVLFLSLCYPPLSTVRPFDQLYERALSAESTRVEAGEQLLEVIPKLAKFAHWCDAPAILDRLQYVVIQLKKYGAVPTTKPFYVALFALEDVGRGVPLDPELDEKDARAIVFFPDAYTQMDDVERSLFAGHALRMFQSFFGHHDDDINRTMKRSLYFRSLKRLARFLLSLLPKPRRSISTQTDAD